ncbi:hypothetical protein TNCV_3157071 [Trichonephila clavipes]|nr:hypothetical protein TNCV_3157071 [Trichonephila clavipes]
MSSSPVWLKTRRLGERFTLNMSKAQTYSGWWGGCHTPGISLHTTVAGKCPSSPEDEQEKQGETRNREGKTLPIAQMSYYAGDRFYSAPRPSNEPWNSCTV